MKFKLKKTNIFRITLQSIILGLIGYVAIRPIFDKTYVSDFEAYCPFGGLSSLGSKISQGTMSCNMSETQVMLGIGLLAAVLILGKLFCSYLCPIGSISEWLGKIGEKLKVRRNVSDIFDRPLRAVKYIILFITLYFTATTSELFCKEFDPYFASVNLFSNTDIVLYFAIPTFLLTILGTVFFRLSWCRYLCPLGALSNIFLNVAFSGGLIILFILLNLIGVSISFVWLLLALAILGLLNETAWMRSFLLPVFKITRNTDKCTSCGLCDAKCPQGIKITEFEKVNHIDCNLCTDCVYACNTKDALTINRSGYLKYISPIAVVLLVALSLGAASNFEFTTISERWGAKKDNLAVYEQTGLKNVKCYGSSKSLQAQLENYAGIYGLDTYAKSHTVKIYYDPTEITETGVKKKLFNPIKQEVRKVKGNSVENLSIWEVGIYGLFDLIDTNNLLYLLREDGGIYGFETHFGEPVKANIFYDSTKTNVDEMLNLIEKSYVMVKKAQGMEKVEIEFKPENDGIKQGTISLIDYQKRIFRLYDRKFNDYKKYDKEKLSVLYFPMPEAQAPALRRYFSSLTSHLSADNGIVRFSTRFVDKPYAYVFFDASQTTPEKIKAALVKPKLTVFTTESTTKDIDNPFHMKPQNAEVKKFAEIQFEDED